MLVKGQLITHRKDKRKLPKMHEYLRKYVTFNIPLDSYLSLTHTHTHTHTYTHTLFHKNIYIYIYIDHRNLSGSIFYVLEMKASFFRNL